MQRIAMRDRSYERNMDRVYIEDLNLAYENFFRDYQGTNVLKLDTSPLDFVASKEHLNLIVNRIKSSLGIPPYQQELPLHSETST